MLAARARALVDGRLSPSLDDVDRAGRAGAQAPHGAHLRRARRGRDDPCGDRARLSRRRSMTRRRRPPTKGRSSPLHPTGSRGLCRPGCRACRRGAQRRADRAPRRPRPAASAGSGETFWQFRPFVSGEPVVRVDWRRSAREEHAFVREREWEAAHTRVDLVRPLALDAVRLQPRAGLQDRPRRGARARLRRPLRARRRARRPSRPDAADRRRAA